MSEVEGHGRPPHRKYPGCFGIGKGGRGHESRFITFASALRRKQRKPASVLEISESGGPGGNRTPDQRLRNPRLYPLNYGPAAAQSGLIVAYLPHPHVHVEREAKRRKFW